MRKRQKHGGASAKRGWFDRSATRRKAGRRLCVENLESRFVLSAAFDVVGLTAMRTDPIFSEIDGTDRNGRIGVAVIDSGLYGQHPDLRSNFVAWFDAVTDGGRPEAVSGPGSTDVNATKDPHGHGTHVAGTVGSSNPEIGVATKAGLIGVRGLPSSEQQPSHDSVLAGLNWVAQNQQRYNIRVVNMSLGWPSNENSLPREDDYSRAIDQLERLGITVVTASGNSFAHWHELGASFPAVYSTLSVANTWEDAGVGDRLPSMGAMASDKWVAIDKRPTADQLAASSQRSTLSNQVAAPGSTIFSTWNGSGGQQYNTISGTSMASPLVAGSVALMQDAAMTFGGRYLSAAEVVDILRTTANRIIDSANADTFRAPLEFDESGKAVIGAQEDLRETGETFLRINVHHAVQKVRDLVTRGGKDPDPPPDPGQRTDDTNNTMASAVALLPLNATNQASASERIGKDGQVNVGSRDVDLFRLILEAPGKLTIATSPTAGGQSFSPIVRLFNSSGQQIAMENGGAGSYPVLKTDRLEIGSYYFGISGFGNAAYDIRNGSGATDTGSGGDFRVVAGLGNPDPNGVVQGAADVNLTNPHVLNPKLNLNAGSGFAGGGPVANLLSGTIGSDPNPLDPLGPRVDIGPTDVDVFRVIAPDTGIMFVDVDAWYVIGPDGVDSYVRVFDSNLTEIASHDDEVMGVIQDSYLEVFVQAGATYYVAVTTFDNREFNPRDPFDRSAPEQEMGVYNLLLSFFNGDVNGTAHVAVPWSEVQSSGGTARGTIGADYGVPLLSQTTNGGAKDVDFFVYTAFQARLLELTATSPDASMVPALAVWKFTTGDEFIRKYTEASAPTARILYEVSAGETILVSVTGNGNEGFNWFAPASGTGGQVGNYELSIVERSQSDAVRYADDSLNLHNVRSLAPGVAIPSDIGNDGGLFRGSTDVDIYRFVPPATGAFRVLAQSAGEYGVDSFLRVFSASGAELASNDNFGNSIGSQVLVDLTAGQEYFIGVSGSSANPRSYDPMTGSGAVAGSLGPYMIVVEAGTEATWHNTSSPFDVSGTEGVTAQDVLIIINWINAHPGDNSLPPPPAVPPPYYDVSGDGLCTAHDVLLVINYINSHLGPGGEGEPIVFPDLPMSGVPYCDRRFFVVFLTSRLYAGERDECESASTLATGREPATMLLRVNGVRVSLSQPSDLRGGHYASRQAQRDERELTLDESVLALDEILLDIAVDVRDAWVADDSASDN